MQVISDPKQMTELSLSWRKKGEKIALVPTMGALHDAHLQLVKKAKSLSQKVVTSIFVNPLQFAPSEDFGSYPRPWEKDIALLEKEKVDVVFAPDAKDFYTEGFSTRVSVHSLSRYLCGVSRPHFFDGVATVCSKLFLSTQADVAVFGEKDFQQIRVLEQMITDLNIPVELVRHPTVREKSGLAMSSRNAYLSESDKKAALVLSQALREAKKMADSAPTTAGKALDKATEIISQSPLVIDYLSMASETDLIPVEDRTLISKIERPRIFVAAHLGKTRLIDNLPLYETT
jgi:pantoate--beta-alanine ligase